MREKPVPLTRRIERARAMTSSAAGQPQRIAIVAPTLAGVLCDRSNLIRALKARGHAVLVVAASHLAGEVAALHHLGGEHRTFDPKPAGMEFFAQCRVVRAVRDILAAWQAETVVVSGEGLAALAASAARQAGARRTVTIIGRFGGGSAAAFRRAVKQSGAIICHNEATARAVKATFELKGKALVVTPGDGVDLIAFRAVPLPAQTLPVRFLMITNPDEQDAIKAYTAAARELTARGLEACFELATDREAAQDTTLLTVADVTFHGRAADPASLLAGVHVAVQLSADDGSPAALKQALATGRPAVTLDVPGCREMVDERVNGCLVPSGDQAALMLALESFVRHRDLMPAEARAARIKAENGLGSKQVLASVLSAIVG
jgi:glycosyltransferase involved in cell wall biosynthesis